MKTLAFPVPEDLITALGSLENATAKAKEAFAMELLREGRIGQGKAAQFLGITRSDLLDLMARYQVPSGPETPGELAAEVAAVESMIRRPQTRAGHQ